MRWDHEIIKKHDTLNKPRALKPLDVNQMASFSVQSAFVNRSFGFHGFDKGWYLTTAQVAILLS